MNKINEVLIGVVVAVIAFGILLVLSNSLLNQKKNCLGEEPIIGEGIIIGPNEFLLNSEQNYWVYDLSADGIKPCAWKCEDGYQKQKNSCVSVN